MKELIEKHRQGELSDSDLIYCVYEILFSRIMRDMGVSCLSASEKHLFYTLALEGQVLNGGFYQYFDNCDGDNIFYAIEGFEVIGLWAAKEIVMKTLLIFPNANPSMNEDVRRDQLQGLTGRDLGTLQELSHEFADLESENAKLFVRFIYALSS
ncbi:DUF4375 domain-containing protein [Vibrio parahaemolyticus]|uniref:DMP19 family protein n=1 Tax=Vibrio harveyi group TaxID=717610 RepID=UPI0004A29D4A|nr:MULTISPECIES: DUF4375 domain-containing protein [Vibrio harveyi group]TNY61279.1 DUF4375 domain-containing protein [Vibrio parahaemolyticus]